MLHIHFSFSPGKPFDNARAQDLDMSTDIIRHYAGWADKIHGETNEVKKASLLASYLSRLILGLLDERADVRLHPS